MMKKIFVLLLFTLTLFASNESKVCQRCHPTIYAEYYGSSHRNASVANDPIHKACWQKHPKSTKGYTCAKCHSPSDKQALQTGLLDEQRTVQKEEPISCLYCHTIKTVKEEDPSNTNVTTGEHKRFFSAEVSRKGTQVARFQTHSSWFGLVKTVSNSPYHAIDYNNENYYNGNVCMGCHAHNDNGHGVDIIMLDALIDPKDKETCISCHMPQVPGTKVTLKHSLTHAYHGIAGIHHMTETLGRYIDLNVTTAKEGFTVTIINHANHALFSQAYREGVLQAHIERNGKEIALKPVTFTRIFGKEGKEVPAWEATQVLKDTLVYAKKDVHFSIPLQKGDRLTLTLGIRLLSPEGMQLLGLQDDTSFGKIRILKIKQIQF